MANLTTSADLKAQGLFGAGELTDGTSDLDDQALVYLNRAYREIYMGGQAFLPDVNETWWWMKAESSIILEANIITGTVNITNNNTSAVFSSTPSPTIDTDVTGWHLKITDHPDIFKVSSIATATATLDTVYTGTTDTTANYTLFKLDYDLSSSAIKLIAPMTAYQSSQYQIEGMATSEMDREYPLALITSGVPTKFSHMDENTVRFNKWGSSTAGEIIRLDYDYFALPTALLDDSTAPLVPLQYRHVLSDMVSYYLLGDKNDSQQEIYGFQAKAGIRSMADENRSRWAQIGKSGHIYPRQRSTNRRTLRTQKEGIIIG
jgi:hypothetical protein